MPLEGLPWGTLVVVVVVVVAVVVVVVVAVVEVVIVVVVVVVVVIRRAFRPKGVLDNQYVHFLSFASLQRRFTSSLTLLPGSSKTEETPPLI